MYDQPISACPVACAVTEPRTQIGMLICRILSFFENAFWVWRPILLFTCDIIVYSLFCYPKKFIYLEL